MAKQDLARAWASIRTELENERTRIVAEIRAYPTPIPRCDDQFNHLIEQRDRLSRELTRLEDSARANEAGESRPAAFIASSECLDEDARRRLKAALEEAAVGSAT